MSTRDTIRILERAHAKLDEADRILGPLFDEKSGVGRELRRRTDATALTLARAADKIGRSKQELERIRERFAVELATSRPQPVAGNEPLEAGNVYRARLAGNRSRALYYVAGTTAAADAGDQLVTYTTLRRGPFGEYRVPLRTYTAGRPVFCDVERVGILEALR